MKESRTTHRLLLVVGIAGALLVILFIGLVNGLRGRDGVVQAAGPSASTLEEGVEEVETVEIDIESEDGVHLWTAIEEAYHDGDRKRLVALGERVEPAQQEDFQRILDAFDGETTLTERGSLAPAAPSAPNVGINGEPCFYATITAAISAASDGDTIYIPSGNTYPEQLGIIDKDLTFVAALADCSDEDPDASSTSVMIDGGGNSETWGGLALIASNKTVTFRHIYLLNAQATYGGILYLDPSSKLILDESQVAYGDATNFGGGVRVYQNASLILQNGSYIHRNEVTGATGGGGGVAAFQGAITVTGGSAIGLGGASNTSASKGGGVYLEDSTLYVEDSYILANNATADGGGIYAQNGAYVALHSAYLGSAGVGNSADQDGGGIFADGSTVLLRDTVVVGNEAGDDGGGVFVQNGSDLIIDTSYAEPTPACDPSTLPADEYCSEVRGNQAAAWGAGLYVDNSTVTIEDTAFIDNIGLSTGTSAGEAILVGNNASVTTSNGLFTGHGTTENTAVHVYGGASFTSIHSTYAGNMDTPLYVLSTAAGITLTNNIIWDNGADAFYQPGATVSASCNDTQDALSGPGNISTDPQFTTTARGAYRLGIGSPAVDACSGTLDHDLDSKERPINADSASSTDFDMGAFERKAYVFLPLVLKNAP